MPRLARDDSTTSPITVGIQTFDFQTCTIDGNWKELPALYLFCSPHGRHPYPYVGETDNAATRFRPHERWQEAVRDYGVTHLLASVAPTDKTERREIERAFIAQFDPPMNKQRRPPLGFYGSMLPHLPMYADRLNALAAMVPPKPITPLASYLSPMVPPLSPLNHLPPRLEPLPSALSLFSLGDAQPPERKNALTRSLFEVLADNKLSPLGHK